jgi:hypothetical protein
MEMKRNGSRLMSGTISECTRIDRAKPRRTQKILYPRHHNPANREYKPQAILTEPKRLINRTGVHTFSDSQRFIQKF